MHSNNNMKNLENTFQEINDPTNPSNKHGFEMVAGKEIKWVRCLTYLINKV